MSRSIDSKWTIGAMASKKASASSPVRVAIHSASGPAVSGPVAMMTLYHVGRRRGDELAADLDQRLGVDRGGDPGGEGVAVDGQRRSRRHPRCVGLAQHQRAEAAHLGVDQPDGVMLGIVGAEAVRADELGERVGVVRLGRVDPAHLVEHHRHPGARRLPRRLATGEPAADDVERPGHEPRPERRKRGS